jgi:ribosomal protein S4
VIQEEMGARPLPVSWIERRGTWGRIQAVPRREDIDADIREDFVVESYAR